MSYSKKGWDYCFISFDNLLLEYMHNEFGLDSAKHMQMLFDPNNKQDLKFRNPYWFANNNYSIDVGDAESESTTDWGIVITQELVEAFHKRTII